MKVRAGRGFSLEELKWAMGSDSKPTLYFVRGGQLGGSSRDLRSGNLGRCTSFSSSLRDSDQTIWKVEPAYSFVGMHFIFDHSKASVTVLKFRNMSSDLFAYGVSDGSLTVCIISQLPSIVKHLSGHSKDVTVYCFNVNG